MDSRILSDDEIEKIVKDVLNNLKENSYEERGVALQKMRRVCGKSECNCNSITPCQKLSRLLKLMHNDITDYSVGLSVITNYSSLAPEKHCQGALERMLLWSLNDAVSGSKYNFLDQLWSLQGLKKFNIAVLEELINKESKYIEEDIFQMFTKVLTTGVDAYHLWREDRFARLVSWSCDSGRIFYIVSSVLNSWMIRMVHSTNQYDACVSVVSAFIYQVKKECAQTKRDFVTLYPREYHGLISLLDIEPQLFPKQSENKSSMLLSTVVELLRQSLSTKPLQTMCILTHFPKWAELIFNVFTVN